MPAQSPRYSRSPMAHISLAMLTLIAGIGAVMAGGRREAEPRWWRGNLHTHSLWSDGDDYPEMIVDWYRKNGYQFLALSDHNVLSEGERWIDVNRNRSGQPALDKYRARFGEGWVEEREAAGKREVRLKPLGEFRSLFEKPGEFLLIQSEEITDSFERLPIHINATNPRELIRPQGGKSVREVMQNNVNAVLAQRQRTGQAMFPHLNHPNFGWAVTAEDLAHVQGERFFEVYNGHPTVHNHGDATHASTDRIWDIVLTLRLGELGEGPIYGIGTDDSHHYHAQAPNRSNSGRGWVMVRSRYLSPEAIIRAMEQGDFYASSGVLLRDVRREGNRLSLEIKAERGVTYTTQFIGTRRGYDRATQPVVDKEGKPLPVTRRYSAQVGEVIAEVKGRSASYTLKGDELYVRARVTSSRPPANPSQEDTLAMAWTQPVVPGQ